MQLPRMSCCGTNSVHHLIARIVVAAPGVAMLLVDIYLY